MNEAHEQYERVCRDKFEQQEKTAQVLFSKIDKFEATMTKGFVDLNNRLFRDNGNKSIVNRISDTERDITEIKEEMAAEAKARKDKLNELEKAFNANPWLKAAKWLTITTASLLIAGFIGLIFWLVRGSLG